MDDLLQPIINILPQKWRLTVGVAVAASPLLGRAYVALRNGGGLKGLLAAIWCGTNTPKPALPEATSVATTGEATEHKDNK